MPSSVQAATYTVTKTADTNDGTCDADCSLREALAVANANAGADTISFNIPQGDSNYNSSSDEWTITLSSSLTISASQSITFDGSTQTGNGTFPDYGGKVIIVTNTNIATINGGTGSDATFTRMTFKQTESFNQRIFVSVGDSASLTIQNSYFTRTIAVDSGNYVATGNLTGNSTISNNKIEKFARGFSFANSNSLAIITLSNNILDTIPSIGINTTGYNTVIQNNTISNSSDQGVISSCSGGTCTISGNTLTGMNSGFASMVLSGVGTHSVTNNTISTENNRAISVTSPANIESNTITGGGGGTDGKILIQTNDLTKQVTIQKNTIAVGQAIPIRIFQSNTRARITQNSTVTSSWFYTPIQLAGGTEDSQLVTANDVGDTDTGANELMNYPVITSVEDLGGSKFRIKGTMDFNPSEAPITVEIFKSDNGVSGHGGSTVYLSTVTVDSDGSWSSDVLLSGDTWSQRIWFTTTATNANGSTSEFSQNAGFGGSSPQSAPTTCQEKGPTSPPVLYGAVAQSFNSILLYFYPPQGDYTYYFLEYGTKSNQYWYGNPNIGFKPMSTFLVKNLSPGTKYYFRVGASNGCASGGWSNEFARYTLGGLTDEESQTKVFGTPIPTSVPSESQGELNENRELAAKPSGVSRKLLIIPVGGGLLLLLWVFLKKKMGG